MDHIFTFHKTVRGYSHVKRDIPCEDSSASYSDDELGFQIICVCDGHGESACLRSSFGSRALADVTVNCLKEYAASIAEEEDYRVSNRNDVLLKRSQDMIIRRLTDIILSRWYQEIFKDLDENPLTEEELNHAGRYQAYYQAGERLEHVYGTTMIAALCMDDLLILLQQGDGRCDVFYEDGSVDQPIPWDDRCFENVTTSMCDEDAGISIRHFIIDLRERPVIACYMGSDGVEDSYIDMEGTHSFYRSLSCKIAEDGTDTLDEYLEGFLPGFSENGSGDDVSVAGIVDLEAIKYMAEKFKIMNEQYYIDSNSAIYRTKLQSMERKHNFLSRKLAEAENKVRESRNAYQQIQERYDAVAKKLKSIEEDIAEEQKNMEDSEKAKSNFDETTGKNFIEEIQKMIGVFRDETQEKIVQLQKKQGEGNGILVRLKEKLTGSQNSVDASLEEYQRIQKEYEEYHQKYESVAAELKRLDDLKKELSSGIRHEELTGLNTAEQKKPYEEKNMESADNDETILKNQENCRMVEAEWFEISAPVNTEDEKLSLDECSEKDMNAENKAATAEETISNEWKQSAEIETQSTTEESKITESEKAAEIEQKMTAEDENRCE